MMSMQPKIRLENIVNFFKKQYSRSIGYEWVGPQHTVNKHNSVLYATSHMHLLNGASFVIVNSFRNSSTIGKLAVQLIKLFVILSFLSNTQMDISSGSLMKSFLILNS